MNHLIPIESILESNIINAILDKISDKGIESLSDEDKWYLNNPEATVDDYNDAHGISNEDPAPKPSPDYTEIEGDDEETIDPYSEEGTWELRTDLYELCREHTFKTIDNSNGQWYIRFDYYPEIVNDIQQLFDKHQGAIAPKVFNYEGEKFIECRLNSDVAIWLTNEFS